MTGRLPGGYIENYKTGEIVHWKAEGAVAQTTPEERAQLAAEAAERQHKREIEITTKHEAAASAASALWNASPAATVENPYCAAKGITSPTGLRTVPEAIPEGVATAHNIKIAKTVREAKAMRDADPEARVFKAGDLLIPGHDAKGKLWTLQSVNPDFKSFMKGGRKHGVLATAGDDPTTKTDKVIEIQASMDACNISPHLQYRAEVQEAVARTLQRVGQGVSYERIAEEEALDEGISVNDVQRVVKHAMDREEQTPIIVAEGYATANTVSKLAGQPVVAAFDSGNLDAVVRELREQFPNRPLLIAADNDHEAETKHGPDGKLRKNVGMEKAKEAAEKHGAGVIAPQFKAGEKGSDWNDRAADKGEEEARREFQTRIALAKREAAINADRLTMLARERDQEARNDPTTSADDARVATERGEAAELITNASEQASNVRAAAAEGLAANGNGRPAAASIMASLDRKNGELMDDTKREQQDVQSHVHDAEAGRGTTVATRQGEIIAQQRHIDIAGDKQDKPGTAKSKRPLSRGIDAGS